MKTVKFEDENGREYYINPDNVDVVEPAKFGNTFIHTVGGSSFIVIDSIEIVLKKLQGD